MASNMSNVTEEVTRPHLVDPLTGLRRMLYLVTPWESSAPEVDKVPKFVDEAIPYFLLLIFIEYIILVCKGRRKAIPLNDSIGSVSGGLISQLPLLLARSIEVSSYIWVYDHWRIAEVPWDSAWAWLAALIGVDFCYYWVHRTAHEVNLFWSGHQMHHSSERYNLTTALRQSVLQRYFSWFTYLPLALVLPPSLFAVHIQFNLLYQFWIHTEVIKKLPAPIEYVMNTPSHHRVHHGRNAYCIDKNYGGTFILFDRIFGTFQAEKDDEPPVYGLIHPVNTFDPIELQLFHLKYVLGLWRQHSNWTDRFRAFFYGPGWQPGTPRLGTDDFSEIENPVQYHNPQVPIWVTAYATLHFFAIHVVYIYLASNRQSLSVPAVAVSCALILLTLYSIGRLIDGFPRSAATIELMRCIVVTTLCVALHSRQPPSWLTGLAQGLHLLSSGLWLYMRSRDRKQQKEQLSMSKKKSAKVE
ncbi:hypothetical protein BOX15_Mlig009958g2 [Macrostomum lignano]|uniref:Alkylglycerol monooxygenase n=1 Tax=Macrostomum lignano TaxID=282301 RepID=A0A267F789_9PLAT|nr:hypothetical protein BOX15_Mlig009958g2 [Macrostomum lignano]